MVAYPHVPRAAHRQFYRPARGAHAVLTGSGGFSVHRVLGDLARDVHDRLAVLLAEMIADRRRIIASERDYALARLQSEAEDEAFDRHHYRVSFAERWLRNRPLGISKSASLRKRRCPSWRRANRHSKPTVRSALELLLA